MGQRRLEKWELAIFERSLAMSSTLPKREVIRLIEEVRRLHDTMDRLRRVLDSDERPDVAT